MVENQILSEKVAIAEGEKSKIIDEIERHKEKSEIRENIKN